MKKLRKDNGGYALAYVLIVVLVLCAVAVSVCTAALKNYQAQERSIRQTQQLYQAEGEIEKFVALAEEVSSLTDSAECDSESEAKDKAKAAYETYLKSLVNPPTSGYTLTLDSGDTGGTWKLSRSHHDRRAGSRRPSCTTAAACSDARCRRRRRPKTRLPSCAASGSSSSRRCWPAWWK